MAEAERDLRPRRLVQPRQHAEQLQGQRVVRLGSHLQHRPRLLQCHRLERLQPLRIGRQRFCMPASIGAFTNSFTSSPNGDGLILDLAYIPFSHGAPGPGLHDLERPHRPPVHRVSPPLRRHEQFRRLVSRRHAQRVGQQFGVRLCLGGVLSQARRPGNRRAAARRASRESKTTNGRENMSARARRHRRCPQWRRRRTPRHARSRLRRAVATGSPGLCAQNSDPGLPDRRAARCRRTTAPPKASWWGRSTPTPTPSNGRSPIPACRAPPIGAHFHGPVSYLGLTPEENAPIQVGTPGNLASPFHGVAKIDDTQAKDLKDGRWYFNLHSTKSSRRRNPRSRRSPMRASGVARAANGSRSSRSEMDIEDAIAYS